MTDLTRVLRPLRLAADTVAALLLGSMFATFILQIAFRYVLNQPLGWTVEYVAMAWLWGILFGYAFVIREADVIRLDIVYAVCPRPVQRGMEIVSGLIVAGVLLWSLPKAWGYVQFMHVERTAFLRIPFDLVFAIYGPFVLAVTARTLTGVWQAIRGTGRHAHPHHGSVQRSEAAT
jgi:TRAP-type C4-dicarboxylate transport system permease small subunit